MRRLDDRGVTIAPYELVVTAKDGTSHTVGLLDLDRALHATEVQLQEPDVASVLVRPVPIGKEDLAGALQRLLAAVCHMKIPEAIAARDVLRAYQNDDSEVF